MADLYLDTEFNGHGGQLISLALAEPDGTHWYEVLYLPPPSLVHPWVKEHVVPFLYSVPPMSAGPVDSQYFRASLHSYLLKRPNATIYADWPEDFMHLLGLLCGPNGESLNWQCTMKLITTPPGVPNPVVPHNALSDAIALMEWHHKMREPPMPDEQSIRAALIKRIADVACAVGWQAGVGASETAGMIVSVLAQHPDQIERFMSEGTELMIDGTIAPELGCLTFFSKQGEIVTPAQLAASRGVRRIKRKEGMSP